MKYVRSVPNTLVAAAAMLVASLATGSSVAIAAQDQAAPSLPVHYVSEFERWMDALADDVVVDLFDPSTGRLKRLNGRAEIRDYYTGTQQKLLDYRNHEGRTRPRADADELSFQLKGTATFSANGTTRDQDYTADLRLRDGRLSYYYWRWEPLAASGSIDATCAPTQAALPPDGFVTTKGALAGRSADSRGRM